MQSDPFAHSRLFSWLSADERELFAKGAERRTIPEGGVLLEMGSPNSSLFVILSGTARVERVGVESPVELAALEPGAVIGELSLLEGGNASATVVASGPTEVLELRFESIEAIFREHPELAARFWRGLATELRDRLLLTNELVEHYVDLSQVLRENPRYAEALRRI